MINNSLIKRQSPEELVLEAKHFELSTLSERLADAELQFYNWRHMTEDERREIIEHRQRTHHP